MDVVIIAQYLRNIEELKGNNSRFIYLANLLSKKENTNVEIITSDFLHGPYKHASKVEQPDNYKITAIKEPGYQKNISLKRFFSHAKLAKNIGKYLETRETPDCIYCAIPSLDVANVAAKYCKKNNVKFIVDIQDLWPEAFKMVLNIPVLSDIIFYPMKRQADNIYIQADEVVAVSNTYCERALEVNKKCDKAHTVFLGTKLEDFDNNSKTKTTIEKKDNRLWLMYCGSLSHSYDLKTVIDALAIMKDKNEEVPYFVIMGDGVKKEEFELYAKQKEVDCLFTGKLEYADMCSVLCKGDIVVNPIIASSPASIINKHGDYAASGLPVLNTQVSAEYRQLVDSYKMGFNCEAESPEDLAEKLSILSKDEELRRQMGKNARKCAVEKFDRKNTYMEILNTILRTI